MKNNYRILTVFISGPSDVQEEKEIIAKKCDEINASFANSFETILKPINWEEHVNPGVSQEPQAVINEQIEKVYDVIIAVFWKTIGSATKKHKSGTIEEIENALKKFKENPQENRIAVYFKTEPPQSLKEINPQQFLDLEIYKETLSGKGVLYKEFRDKEDFQHLVGIYLGNLMGKLGTKSQTNETPLIKEDAIIQEGFLDSVIVINRNTKTLMGILQNLAKIMIEFNTKTEQHTKEINSINTQQILGLEKTAKFIWISNMQATAMEDYSFKTQVELSDYDRTATTLYESMRNMIITFSDFGSGEENLKNLSDILNSSVILKSSITENKSHLQGFLYQVEVLPRTTIQIIQAKKKVITTVKRFISILEKSENILAEVIKMGKELQQSWQ